MSSISGVGSTPYIPVTSQMKQPVANQQPSTSPVQPVVKDADGDNDGSRGGKIDAYA